MRNPRRWRNVGLVFAASGIALMIAHFLLPREAVQNPWPGLILILYWPNAILFGGGAALFCHFTGDGADRENLSRCYGCGYESHQFLSHCPRCGVAMQSKLWSRRFGWVLMVGGLFITLGMGAVIYVTAPFLLRAGVSINGKWFSGTAAQGLYYLGTLGVVATIGLTALLYGLCQIRTSQSDQRNQGGAP